jgi:hypothetical protein
VIYLRSLVASKARLNATLRMAAFLVLSRATFIAMIRALRRYVIVGLNILG